MRRYVAVLIGCAVMLSASLSAGAAPARLSHLAPGQKADLTEKVPVNFVFVGYERDRVDQATFLAGLPAVYRPIVWSRLLYGIVDYLGLTFTYDYDVTYTRSSYENRFFDELSSLAEPADLTFFQQAYNDQKKNVIDVADNHLIDAPSVEEWLAKNPPGGVDTSENTIFFIDWYGRDDFKHHVYTKTDEPDPDTGVNFGAEQDAQKVIAWGGTPPDDEESGFGKLSRVWFYDLSAGPEAWTINWNVDNPDIPGLDANSKPDYRMPPTWEYAANGFRRPAALSSDLSKVARYVGIDALFTTSPSFPPDITPPALPELVNLDATTYEGLAGVEASKDYVTESLLVEELAELQPLLEVNYDNEDRALKGQGLNCYVRSLQYRRCYPKRPYPAGANLTIYNALRAKARRDDVGTVDYEASLSHYSVGAKLDTGGLLGFADDNRRDGTQSVVISFLSPQIVEAGYGLTTTDIHEYGHHAAMSHPHEGLDYEMGMEIYPVGQYFFVWSGDESNSVMSYMSLNWDFSQFDRDNMARYLAAEYVTYANRIAARVLADPDADQASGELETADEAIGRAKRALSRHDYLESSRQAKRAYDLVHEAADEVGVDVIGSEKGIHVDPPVGSAARPDDRPFIVDKLGKNGRRAYLP